MTAFFYWLTTEVSIFSWLVTLGLDLVWNLFDGTSIFSGLGILCYPVVMGAIFLVCLGTVALIQHYGSGDEWKAALNKGLIFGAIAALPFSVFTLVAGGIGLIVKSTRGGEYEAAFGRFSLNYRDIEKTIKREAVGSGMLSGNWREIRMEEAIDTLERTGKLSRTEANELHQLRIARNNAYHEETPSNLQSWVEHSGRLLQRYRERFGE